MVQTSWCLTLVLISGTCALDNGVSLLPHRGWSSWNLFRCQLNETSIHQTADAMVSSGLADAGYNLLNLDDCYMDKNRDPTSGRIVADPSKFPSGMKALGDYIHKQGLLYGVYLDCGTATCQNYPGSQDHEVLDAQTIGEKIVRT
jgi:alpha-galactosidase